MVLVGDEASEGLVKAAGDGRITWIRRNYQAGDLKDAFLAIVSETNPSATAPIYEEAEREKVLINAMDDVPHCTFVAGSVVRRGKLVMAISTSGAAPALSVRLRERLEEEIGPEYETLLTILAELRNPMANRYPDFQERRAQWYRIIDSDVLDVVRTQGQAAARAFVADLVGLEVTSDESR